MTTELNPLYEETIRVSTFECDFKQQWKPAALWQRLTEAAVTHAARLGAGYQAMLAENLYWVHSRQKIEFYRFPQPGETVTIRTWPKTVQQKLFYIRNFELVDAAGERLAAATSAWVIINAATRRLVPPQTLKLSLPALPERAGLNEPLEKLGLARDGEERLRARAGYSAVDLLGHVNNSRYVEWISDAFTIEMHRQQRLAWLQVNYDHEVLPGEEVSVRANPLDETGRWAVEGHNCANDTRAFEALLQWG